jgi:hypothetical protein
MTIREITLIINLITLVYSIGGLVANTIMVRKGIDTSTFAEVFIISNSMLGAVNLMFIILSNLIGNVAINF